MALHTDTTVEALAMALDGTYEFEDTLVGELSQMLQDKDIDGLKGVYETIAQMIDELEGK
jgi:hypothetical protein